MRPTARSPPVLWIVPHATAARPTDWTTHAQDHTTQVTQQTECSSCHTATVEYANFVDPANDVKHDNCYVCHDNTTKLASATAGDCSQCHTANYFDSHTHSHDVSYNPLTDTSQTTQQGCARLS